MSQLNVDAIKDRTGNDQPDIIGTAKAWVYFNGIGVVAIIGSFNVSSITDNGVGDYTINYTNNMANANYCIASHITTDTLNTWSDWIKDYTPAPRTVSSLRIRTGYANAGADVYADKLANVTIFGD